MKVFSAKNVRCFKRSLLDLLISPHSESFASDDAGRDGLGMATCFRNI